MALVCNGKQVRVRLHCIDAPEMGQGPGRRAAREHLADVTPRTVIVVPKRTERGHRDRFGRIVGEVLTPDGERRNLGMAQVVSGQAAVYDRYCATTATFGSRRWRSRPAPGSGVAGPAADALGVAAPRLTVGAAPSPRGRRSYGWSLGCDSRQAIESNP